MAEATSNEMVFSYEPKNKISKEKVLKLKISSNVSNCTSQKQLWSFFYVELHIISRSTGVRYSRKIDSTQEL